MKRVAVRQAAETSEGRNRGLLVSEIAIGYLARCGRLGAVANGGNGARHTAPAAGQRARVVKAQPVPVSWQYLHTATLQRDGRLARVDGAACTVSQRHLRMTG